MAAQGYQEFRVDQNVKSQNKLPRLEKRRLG